MKKMRLLFAVVMAVCGTAKSFAGIDGTTAWFIGQDFSGYTAGQDVKSTFGITSSYNAYIAGTTTSTASTNGNALCMSRANSQVTFGEYGNASNWTKTFSSAYTSQYFYIKTAFFSCTGGTTYTLRNSSGQDVFQFGGSGSKYGPDVWTTGASATTTGLGIRSQWSDIEVIIDLVNKKVVKCSLANSSLSTKSYSFLNYPLINGADIKTLYMNTVSYSGVGFDNTTIGQLIPDNIKNINSNQTSHQSVDGSTINTILGVTSFTTKMNTDLPFGANTYANIVWSVSDWGGLSAEDQAKVSITRGASDYTSATLSTNGALSADATITISAVLGSTTLTKTIDMKGGSIDGVKATLLSEITTAGGVKDAVSASNPYISGLKSALADAIAVAQHTHDTSSSSTEIGAAITTLQTAEAVFTSGMNYFNTFVTYVGTVTAGCDAEARIAPFFTAIKTPLTSAIEVATAAESTVTSTTDISDAQTALQTAYTQFNADRPAYDNLNTQITTVANRLTAVNLRKGDTRFLMFPTATVQTLTDAKTAAETTRDNATTVTDMSTAQATLASALSTFNAAARVGTGTGYYRIYTYGADGGDGNSTKKILFAEGAVLKYKNNTSSLEANSVWEINETTTNKYTIRNVATGNYMNGTSLSATSSEFTFPENKSQAGNILYSPDTYFIYSIVNASSKALEVDLYNDVTATGAFVISAGSAERYRFAYQFEPVKTWKGTGSWSSTANWSDGTAPATEDVVVGTGIINMDQDAAPANLMIASGAQLSVNAGKKLTVSTALANNGTLDLLSDANGTATILTPTSLSGNGTYNVQQYLTGANNGTVPNGRFWYVSSPVAGATSNVFDAAGTNKLWSYSEEAHAYTEALDNTTPLAVGAGYVARLGADNTVTFTGTLNTGEKTVSLSRQSDGNAKRGYNLVGNPYPSFLNWSGVNKTNVLNTVWYRTMNGSSNTMTFDTYNSLTGIGTNNNGSGAITSYIPPMQAFWVKVDADGAEGSLTFNNSMRSVADESTSTNKLRSASIDDKQVLRLKVSGKTCSDEAIIAFKSEASAGFDAFDSPKQFNNIDSLPEIYTLAGTEQLVINGLNNPAENNRFALGFKAGRTDAYTISATQSQNFDADTKVLLVDNLLNKTQDLTDGTAYSFTADAINTTGRFTVVLSNSSQITTGIGQTAQLPVLVYKNEKDQITVKLPGTSGVKGIVALTGILGQPILLTNITGEITVLDTPLNAGVYLVTVKADGLQVTKKVVIKE